MSSFSQIDLEEEGVLYKSCIQRLESVNLYGIRLPHYSGKLDLFWMSNVLGYTGFLNDLNHLNSTIIIDRLTSEAAFYRTVLKRYSKLGMHLDKMFDSSVEGYWLSRKELAPDLDIFAHPPDSDEDRYQTPDAYTQYPATDDEDYYKGADDDKKEDNGYTNDNGDDIIKIEDMREVDEFAHEFSHRMNIDE